MQDYHGLRVWKKGQDLVVAVHQLVAKFPRRGSGSIRSQLIRAVESIPANVVEGCGASSGQDFARYLDYSIKSACEVEHHIETAERLHFVTARQRDWFAAEVILIRKMTINLKRRVLDDERLGGHE